MKTIDIRADKNGNIGIGTKTPSALITIHCPCGGEFLLDGGGEWEIDLRGDWAFTHKCGHEVVLPRDVLSEFLTAMKKPSPLMLFVVLPLVISICAFLLGFFVAVIRGTFFV